METQHWIFFVLLSSYRILYTAIGSIKLLGLYVKYPTFLPDCNQIWSLSEDLSKRLSSTVGRVAQSV